MLNSLYLEAAKKRNSLKEILPEIKDENTISEKWDEIKFDADLEDFSIAAGDGSFNKRKFLAFTFYAVCAESVIFDGEFKTLDDSIINTIEHDSFIDDLLRLYMSVLETKSAIKTLEYMEVDYYLLDGSLFGDLIRPFPLGINIKNEKREELLSKSLDKLEESTKLFNTKLEAPKIIDEFCKEDNKIDYKMFLTSIEQLLLLKELLQYNRKIIAISKTSTNRDLFNSNIPDISIFDKYTRKSGMSKIIYKKVSDEVPFNFLVENEFFKNQVFTIFYLRLEDYKNVIKVELPYKASKKEVLTIISKIKKYSSEGYPYLLKKAHNDVLISYKDMDTLTSIVNIREKIGREMLK